MTVLEIAESIRDAVLADLLGRRGFDSAWDGVDADIQEEIRAEVLDLVAERLRSAGITDGE